MSCCPCCKGCSQLHYAKRRHISQYWQVPKEGSAMRRRRSGPQAVGCK